MIMKKPDKSPTIKNYASIMTSKEENYSSTQNQSIENKKPKKVPECQQLMLKK